MPWRCPACRSEIQNGLAENFPDPSTEYRCHVCRLDLRFDAVARTMVVAPFQTDRRVTTLRPRRVTPTPWQPRRQKA